jgi:hypothetical protein
MKAEIEVCDKGRSTAYTLIKATHNGYQWSAITVYSDSELRQIRDKINEHLSEK